MAAQAVAEGAMHVCAAGQEGIDSDDVFQVGILEILEALGGDDGGGLQTDSQGVSLGIQHQAEK